ncbi:MAG: hypothetical protein U5L75_00770 [Candidatus Campbellbacteria bacterium]|nr:hypothetical protein [Candidatus Campbellbacteria bacterium]
MDDISDKIIDLKKQLYEELAKDDSNNNKILSISKWIELDWMIQMCVSQLMQVLLTG